MKEFVKSHCPNGLGRTGEFQSMSASIWGRTAPAVVVLGVLRHSAGWDLRSAAQCTHVAERLQEQGPTVNRSLGVGHRHSPAFCDYHRGESEETMLKVVLRDEGVLTLVLRATLMDGAVGGTPRPTHVALDGRVGGS
jgi:hypothetical protein